LVVAIGAGRGLHVARTVASAICPRSQNTPLGVCRRGLQKSAGRSVRLTCSWFISRLAFYKLFHALNIAFVTYRNYLLTSFPGRARIKRLPALLSFLAEAAAAALPPFRNNKPQPTSVLFFSSSLKVGTMRAYLYMNLIFLEFFGKIKFLFPFTEKCNILMA
jgi:hypothetical protein